MTDYTTGMLEGIARSREILRNFLAYEGQDFADGVDILDEYSILLDKEVKKIKGSVAQMATPRPAKTAALNGVVGSNPTATAKGKTFVFTGKLHRMTRAKAWDRTVAAGGFYAEKFSTWRRIDYLVVGAAIGSVKWNDAVAKGIPVLSEDEWYDLTKPVAP